ncbi:MAG: methyl-accepting chemotaxis protein [Sulfitobacter sp.]|jgi:methyl-accepting chemotaxis protein
MDLVADIFLAAGALGAGFYCFVLGRRLNRFNDLEKGVGGAVAVLSAQVDDLTKTLTAAQATANHSAQTLQKLSERAEKTARQLELQMAALHDLPSSPDTAEVAAPKAAPAPAPPIPPSEPMFVRRHSEGPIT